MPFTKVGPDHYVSPSGRSFTKKQVEMYYATNGFKDDMPDGAVKTHAPVLPKSPVMPKDGDERPSALHTALLTREVKKRLQ